jgi:TPR repeat protein
MARTIVAVCSAAFVFLIGVSGARADGTITITASSVKCQVPKPDDVAAPVTPSVAAGAAAARNRNFAQAEANFRPLAESGNPEGERSLGQLLMQNCTGLQDKATAVTWLTKAADGGDIPAQTMLGDAYMNGNGVAQDDGKAFDLLSKAAAAGNANAQKSLGYLYLSGRGVASDKYEGMLWSIKAAEQGDATALGNIANGYLTGNALPQDNDKAAYFIAVAMLHAVPNDMTFLLQTRTNISRKMSQDDVQSAAKRAKDWSPGTGSLSSVLRDAARRRDQKS